MRYKILQVPFDALTFNKALETLHGFLQTERNHLVITPNPECVMLAQRNKNFLHILKNADLTLVDGMGILLAARLKKLPIPERVPGCDITQALLESSKGHSIYLLGAAPGIAEKAMYSLQKQGINVLAAHDGYFNEAAEPSIIEEIQSLKPDILIIGMGMPRQEEWAAANLHKMPCKITLCVGGSIDIFSGNVRRAPHMLRRLGLEWLYRLITNPSRAKRMLSLPCFAWAIFYSIYYKV